MAGNITSDAGFKFTQFAQTSLGTPVFTSELCSLINGLEVHAVCANLHTQVNLRKLHEHPGPEPRTDYLV